MTFCEFAKKNLSRRSLAYYVFLLAKGSHFYNTPILLVVEVEQTFANQIYFDSQSVPTIIFNLHLNVSFSFVFLFLSIISQLKFRLIFDTTKWWVELLFFLKICFVRTLDIENSALNLPNNCWNQISVLWRIFFIFLHENPV